MRGLEAVCALGAWNDGLSEFPEPITPRDRRSLVALTTPKVSPYGAFSAPCGSFDVLPIRAPVGVSVNVLG